MRHPIRTQRRLLLGYVGAGLATVMLFLSGLAWFLGPEQRSLAGGIEPLVGSQQAFAYIKGMENIIAALLIAIFLWRRDRVGTLLALLAVLIVPAGDSIAAYRVGISLANMPIEVPIVAAAILAAAILLGLGGGSDTGMVSDGDRVSIPSGLGKRLVLAVAGIMIAAIALGFTTRWMVDPVGLSSDWGAELSGNQVAYAYVKGFEDLFVSAAILLFALRRKRTELVLVLALSLLIVVGDQLAQTLGGFFVLEMFVAHVAYLVVVGGAIAVLRSSSAASGEVLS